MLRRLRRAAVAGASRSGLALVFALALVAAGCGGKSEKAAAPAGGYKVGLVFDIGGRGGKTFHDAPPSGPRGGPKGGRGGVPTPRDGGGGGRRGRRPPPPARGG